MAYIDGNGKLIYNQITHNSTVQANYLASKKDGIGVDDGINIYTGIMPWNWGTPPCSHTEIGVWVDGELWFYSSTSRAELGANGENGTRWRKGTELLHNSDRWKLQVKEDFFYNYPKDILRPALEVNLLISAKIRRANGIIGLRYDFKGVFTDFIIPWEIWKEKTPTPEEVAKLTKIYCSKAVHYVDTGKLGVWSPKRQYTWANDNGYVLIPDTLVFIKDRGVQV